MESEHIAFLLLLVSVIAVSFAVMHLTARGAITKDSFLVANWNVPIVAGAITLTATWTQVPALLFSGNQAYQGLPNFISFFGPNSLALPVALLLAVGIREVLPRGYNIPQYMGEVYGGSARLLTFFLAFTTLVIAVAYTIVGMKLWLAPQLGIPTWSIAFILGVAAIAWVFHRGTQAAVGVDKIKVALVFGGLVGVILLWAYWSYGATTIAGKTPTNVPAGTWWTLWVMGVPLAASLIPGPIVNPDLGERFYAIDKKVLRRSYLIASFLFALVVVVFGSLGVLAHWIRLSITGKEIIAFGLLKSTLSSIGTVVVTVGLAVVLAAALASFVASAGNLLTVEVYNRLYPNATSGQTVAVSRFVMVIPVVLGTLIAIPESIDIGVLLKALAPIRGELLIPIIVAVFWPKRTTGVYIFTGMLLGLVGGVVLTYATMVSATPLPFLAYHGAPLGALWAVFIPLIFVIIGWRKNRA